MPERYRWILDVLTIIGGIYMFVEIGLRVRSRFWRTGAGARQRSGGEYAAGAGLALACGVLWSLSYVSLKYVSGRLHVLDVSAAVLGWAVVFLLVARMVALGIDSRRKKSKETLPDWSNVRTFFLAVANLGNFGLSIWALYYISATQAMTLNNMSPLFLVALLLFRRKLRLTGGTFAAVVIVLLGAWILTAGAGFTAASAKALYGSIIAVAAGAAFALWADLIDDVEADIELTSTRLGFLATIFFASFSVAATVAWIVGPSPSFSVEDIAILAANGLRVALVYVLFQLAVRYAGPLLALVVAVSQVPLTLMWEALFLDLGINRQLVIGVLAILAGAIALLIDHAHAKPKSLAANPAA